MLFYLALRLKLDKNNKKILCVLTIPINKILVAYVIPCQIFFFPITDNIDKIVINYLSYLDD